VNRGRDRPRSGIRRRPSRELAAVSDTDGAVVSVSEADLPAETDRLAADAGVAVEPSRAVATAAVRDLAAAGEFGHDDGVAVILTRSGYKYGLRGWSPRRSARSTARTCRTRSAD
jgi:threonine synthase